MIDIRLEKESKKHFVVIIHKIKQKEKVAGFMWFIWGYEDEEFPKLINNQYIWRLSLDSDSQGN